MMSRFLILSVGGDGCGLALRLQSEGHDARIWIQEPDAEHRCEGLVQSTDEQSFGEIIIADCTGFGPILDVMHENGRLIFGGSSFHDRLEGDREFSKEIMLEAGIQTPDSIYLKGPDAWEKAIEFVNSSTSRLVLKPGGKLSGVIPSYVSSDSEDLIGMLGYFRTKVKGEAEFELQEFKEGICVSTEGWFNGNTFVGPFNHTIERKQLMCGDIGPSGGCTGNLVWTVDNDGDPLVDALLGMASILRRENYIGPIDLNAVVGDEGFYGLEFTPRFGYDAFPTFLHGLFEGNFGSWVSNLSRGGSEDPALRSGFAAGVRISLPPWPSEDFKAQAGIPIRGLTAADLRFFYPYDVALKGDELESSGGWGIVGVINGVGDTLNDAFDDAYRSVKHLRIPDMQYRTDLGEVCGKDFRKLASLMREMA